MADQNVVIIGAGPASLYAAGRLAKEGKNVFILNRDIKPGGLAEFGIYLNKYKMKSGLRRVFTKTLSDERVHYLGNVRVGQTDDALITLEELRELGFDAIVVAVGAQGTKWLGLPGEDADGVLHAKDLVYHYNGLPPFSEKDYGIGQNVCVVGIGNVSLDIVHWLVCEHKAEKAIAVARRGPAERAYTEKEMKIVSGALDLDEVDAEFERIGASLEAVGQSVETLKEEIIQHRDVPLECESDTRFSLRFLRSPSAIEKDENGRVSGLVCDVTRLVERPERMGVEATGETETIPCDTVVFAIGDSIEPGIGLPLDPRTGRTFAVCPDRWEKEPERERYMVWDTQTQEPLWGTFVVGWARRASDGLVGKARADAMKGCDEVLAYLDGEFEKGPGEAKEADALFTKLREVLAERSEDVVDYDAIKLLEEHEKAVAEEKGLPEWKVRATADMLAIMRGQE